MSEISFIATIAISVLFILIYVWKAWKSKSQSPSLTHAIQISLGGLGIVTGAKLCLMAFVIQSIIRGISHTDRVYIFIGGMAVVWVSVDLIRKILKSIGMEYNRLT